MSFLYECELAYRGFARNFWGMVIAMLTIAIGVAAVGVLLTIVRLVYAVPEESEKTFRVQVDPRRVVGGESSLTIPEELSYNDAQELYRSGPASSSVLMARSSVRVVSDVGEIEEPMPARYTTHEFFSIFRVPLRAGRFWDRADDQEGAVVAVISARLNAVIFGEQSGVGRSISIQGTPFTIVGVLRPWRPVPRYYDLSQGTFSAPEDVFIPLSTARNLKFPPSSQISCWDGADPAAEADSPLCAWVQMWVRLENSDRRQKYLQFLNTFAEIRNRRGDRSNVSYALDDLREWLRLKRSIPEGTGFFTIIAFGFLALCLVNTATYLMSNFDSRTRGFSIRRALGSAKVSVARQLLIESIFVGAVGGACGIALLILIIQQMRSGPLQYAEVLSVDHHAVLLTWCLSTICGGLSGLLPSWWISRVTPITHLRSQ